MQIKDTDIERQCDDILVEIIRTRYEEFLKLCKSKNATELESQGALSPYVEKSPPRKYSTGQTDIGFSFKQVGKDHHLLIENKVMSPFTYRQPERYAEEVRGINSQQNILAYSLLICPQKYLVTSSHAQKFDLVLSYEDLISTFGMNATLERAIERCEQGWIAEEVRSVTDNFLAYISLSEEFEKLSIKTRPTNKPVQSRTIYFDEKKSGAFAF